MELHFHTDFTVPISAIGQGQGFFRNYEAPRRSATELGLFLDAPWGNIVEDRRGDIMLEHLYPRGGLLGGSGGPPEKTSKLAALAKARKEKSEAQKKQQQSLEGEKKPVASMLSRLSQKKSPLPIVPPPITLDVLSKRLPENAPSRAPTPSSIVVPNKADLNLDQSIRGKPEKQPPEEFVPALDLRAGPSKFAVSMFGDRIKSSYEIEVTDARMFSLPGVPVSAQEFTGPSPDDVVAAAQSSSKGRKKNHPVGLTTRLLSIRL